MTFPEFTPVVEGSGQKRDPSEFVPWRRCVETPQRPGKLLIVRPLSMIDDYREMSDEQKAKKARGEEVWRGKLVIADVALLDAIPMIPDDGQGNQLPGFAAGTQFRNNTILLGYLNKAFRDYVGKTCLGTVYTQPSGYAQPAIHWRDLAGDPNAVQRARSFLQAFPDFLIPLAAQFTEVAPAQNEWAQPVTTHAPVQGYGQQPQGYPQPVSAPPQGNTYGGPDPWAQQASQPVSPAPQAAPAHPGQGMSTIDQLKMAAQQQNHQGQPQSPEPPF